MGMLGSAKPLASLSSTLLARKGQARPAMRPQGFNHAPAAAQLEDLGWNDMGGQAPEPTPKPAPAAGPEPLPPVLEERHELARQVEVVAPEPAVEPEPIAPTPVAVTTRKAARIARESAAHTANGKAAFTLRLDAARHLRLRLASAVANRSAQRLVAQALDDFLLSMPEVEALAAQLPTGKART